MNGTVGGKAINDLAEHSNEKRVALEGEILKSFPQSLSRICWKVESCCILFLWNVVVAGALRSVWAFVNKNN
jgi:hypothetical protein